MFVEFYDLAEVLQMRYELAEWEGCGNSEGILSLSLLLFIHQFMFILDKL